MQIDPRTLARDIPGIFNEIFPQLTPGIVTHFNSEADILRIEPISKELVESSKLQRAMLFEFGYSAAEALLREGRIDWEQAFRSAVERQKAFYDAKVPAELTAQDKSVAEAVGKNICSAIKEIADRNGQSITSNPRIPGLEWISSSFGDFSVGNILIEIKCTNKRFSAADYRQVAIYWLLSYASSIERRGTEWTDFVLLNPRLGLKVSLNFDKFLFIISSGRTKVEILQLFKSFLDSRLTR